MNWGTKIWNGARSYELGYEDMKWGTKLWIGVWRYEIGHEAMNWGTKIWNGARSYELGYEDINLTEQAHDSVKQKDYSSTAMKYLVSNPENVLSTSLTVFEWHHVTAVTVRSYQDRTHAQKICFVIQCMEHPWKRKHFYRPRHRCKCTINFLKHEVKGGSIWLRIRPNYRFHLTRNTAILQVPSDSEYGHITGFCEQGYKPTLISVLIPMHFRANKALQQ
jgi:hypothetical protein